jgi:hypothetical protein
MDGAKDKRDNTKITADVSTLSNGFKMYAQETSEYPIPQGNLKFYGEDTGYRHTYEEAF